MPFRLETKTCHGPLDVSFVHQRVVVVGLKSALYKALRSFSNPWCTLCYELLNREATLIGV